MKKTHPFPYIGSGIPADLHSIELEIKFSSIPDAKQSGNLISIAPAILELTPAHLTDEFLVVYKYEGVKSSIERIYVKGEAGLQALEDAIEVWLKAAHEICPIEIVMKPQDWRTSGTHLSEWHDASCSRALEIIEDWLHQPENKYRTHDNDFNRLSTFVDEISSYIDDPENYVLVQRALKTFQPQAYLSRLLEKKEWDAALQLIEEKRSDVEYLVQIMEALSDYIIDVLVVDQKVEHCVYHLTKQFLQPENLQYFQTPYVNFVGIALHIAVENADRSTLEGLRYVIQKAETKDSIINHLMYFTFKRYMENKRWAHALVHYEFIFDLLDGKLPASGDYSMYCNALYVLQNDVTGLGVQHERNKITLEICLAVAPLNPAIYFNAATLYVEMRQYKSALLNFKRYFSSADGNKQMLFNGLNSESMYADFRAFKGVQTFLNTLKNEIS